MQFGDGVDTTETSIIWNDTETRGKDAQGQEVSAPTPPSVEETLRGEILDLLQDKGLDLLKSILPDKLFVENAPLPDASPDEADDEEPLPEEPVVEEDV